jgi:hypothetical protein
MRRTSVPADCERQAHVEMKAAAIAGRLASSAPTARRIASSAAAGQYA